MPDPKPGLTFYRRGHEPAIHVRDLHGGHLYLVLRHGHYVAHRVASSAPWYNRVDWANSGRTTRGRSRDLRQLFASAPPAEVLDSAAVDLPPSRCTSRRTSQQGMAPAMNALYYPGVANPPAVSATEYARRLGINDVAFEWCHLIAHSLGGGDGPGNVVAGARYNNSEQLIIENLLSCYGAERAFVMQVSARLLNLADGRYMGQAIRYTISSGGHSLAIYLDCQEVNRPTALHVSAITQRVARWMNDTLRARAIVHVTPDEIQRILADCPQLAEPVRGPGVKRRGPDDDLGDRTGRLSKRGRF